MSPGGRWLLLVMVAMCGGAATAQPPSDPPTALARGGVLEILPNPEALSTLGLTASGWSGERDQPWRLPFGQDQALRIALGDGAPTAVLEGLLPVPGLVLRAADGSRSPPLALVGASKGLGFSLIDAEARQWLTIGHAMRSPDVARDGLTLITADLRAGPALAAWRGDRRGEGLLLGNVTLRVPLSGFSGGPSRDHAKSCDAPNWPGSPGFVTDVLLRNIDRVDVLRCRSLGGAGGNCDGPGGADGEVVVVPSATLANSDGADTADVPWYTKFTGVFEPYDNDQHPYLVWSLYRLDPGQPPLQYARSALKHAFATANTGCIDATCGSERHILGRGCEDLYNAGSNDLWSALGPRDELIPVSGIWGRCGSRFDPDCDGQAEGLGLNDGYSFRMLVRETDLDPALHPGSRWLIDAWYVVREDQNVFNTMGWREAYPEWTSFLSRWTVRIADPGETPVPITSGHVLDQWHAEVPVGATSLRSLHDGADGKLLLVSRATPDGDGWRYDYALANIDYARVTTEGAEPDLRITATSAIAGFSLDIGGHTGTGAPQALDPARGEAAGWTSVAGCGGPAWQAADAADLAWGETMAFTLTSPHPPVERPVRAAPRDAAASDIDLQALVPDTAIVFCQGFESN